MKCEFCSKRWHITNITTNNVQQHITLYKVTTLSLTHLTDDNGYNEHSQQVAQHLYSILQVIGGVTEVEIVYGRCCQYCPVETMEIAIGMKGNSNYWVDTACGYTVL